MLSIKIETAQGDPGPPTANAGGPYSGDEGEEVVFSGDASDPEDASNLLTYEWDFEFDGSFNIVASGVNLTAPGHTYGNDGPFTVALRVRDTADEVSLIATASVTIANVLPSANAGGPYAVDEGTALTFSGSATEPGNDTLTYEWDFEHNNVTFNTVGPTTAAGVDLTAPSYTYPSDGVFTAALRVRDDDGVSTIVFAEVTVNPQADSYTHGDADSRASGNIHTNTHASSNSDTYAHIRRHPRRRYRIGSTPGNSHAVAVVE